VRATLRVPQTVKALDFTVVGMRNQYALHSVRTAMVLTPVNGAERPFTDALSFRQVEEALFHVKHAGSCQCHRVHLPFLLLALG